MPTDSLTEIATRHQVHLERLKAGAAKKNLRFLKKIDRSVSKRLAGKEITEFKRARLEKLIASVQGDMAVINGEITNAITTQARELAASEAGFEIRSLNEVVKVDFAVPTAGQLNSAVMNNPLSVKGPDGGKLLKSFLKDTTNRQTKAISSAIRSGYYQGQSNNEILRVIRGTRSNKFKDGIIARVGNTANALVRTALQHASVQAREATWNANKDIIKKVRWTATIDGRTSQICRSLDGREFDFDKGPRPPIHINCLTGDTNVTTCGGVSNVYKRAYKGTLVDIKTASGRTISITPNHPILAVSGWKAAGDVNSFDKLVCVTSPHLIVNNDKNSVDSTFSELFSAVNVVCDSSAISNAPSAAEDFHGDGASDSNIKIISTVSLGWDGVRKAIFNSRKNNRLPFGSRMKLAFARFCSFGFFFNADDPSSNGVMRCARKVGDLLGAGVVHSNLLLLRFIPEFSVFGFEGADNGSGRAIKPQVPSYTGRTYPSLIGLKDSILAAIKINDYVTGDRNAVRGKDSSDWLVANAEELSDCFDGEPINGTELDDVVSVSRREVDCHVYNLENKNNWYVSNGIITHNCRSSVVPVLKDKFSSLRKGATRFSRGPDGVKYIPATKSYYGWLKNQPAKFQDSAIGKTRGALLRRGGLSSEQFSKLNLNNKFQPVTLADMRKLEPAAFEKANL